MQKLKRLLQNIVVVAAVLGFGYLGLYTPLDNAMRNLRFDFASRPATGSIVFVAIDPHSLNEIGVWPWPRRIHAELVDKLIEMDASDILFDVDFSTASNETDDAIFEKALENAGGFVGLAAFRQAATVDSDVQHFNLPLPRFAANAQIADVNVRVDPDGILRSYALGEIVNGKTYDSPATLLSGRLPQHRDFNIDFGIDIGNIDIISVSDILDDRIDAARIKGRQVVVGASAMELRDNFAVPRYGILPGPMVQILAAETLKQGRDLVSLGWRGAAFLALGIALIFFLVHGWRGLNTAVAVAAVSCLGVEFSAFVLQAGPGLLVNTTMAWVAFGALALEGYYHELDIGHLLLRVTRRERDSMRSILDRVITDNFDGVVVVSSAGQVIAASRLAEQVLGFSAASDPDISTALPARLAVDIRGVLDSHEHFSAGRVRELTLTDAAGVERIIEYVVTLSRLGPGDAEPAQETDLVACLTFRDITERRASEKRLGYLAAHDPLTGAFTRPKLVEIINDAMSSEEGRITGMTIALLDLSRFKVINDTLGHTQGDSLLKQVVERMSAADVDCVARTGGDTFAAARAGVLEGAALRQFCMDILQRVSQPYHLGESRAIIGGRLGVTTTDLSGFDPGTLISHADVALSGAKSAPLDGYAVFNEDMDKRINAKQQMETALRHSIESDEFFLLYQPQVSLADGQLVGAEALVRWSHPELGLVAPGRFVPVAEETGLIIELGRWALRTACMAAGTWGGAVRIGVNVSPMQFEFADIVKDVEAALQASGLPPGRLEIEITEGMLISRPALVIEKLGHLKALGVNVALDDFGTGYSSLSYLDRLPIDTIKIDRTFVSGLPHDQHSSAVVRAVMTLSESLGKTVIAEGIENADQAWMLRMAGCHIGQGYYYDRPVSSEEIVERIAGPAYKIAR